MPDAKRTAQSVGVDGSSQVARAVIASLEPIINELVRQINQNIQQLRENRVNEQNEVAKLGLSLVNGPQSRLVNGVEKVGEQSSSEMAIQPEDISVEAEPEPELSDTFDTSTEDSALRDFSYVHEFMQRASLGEQPSAQDKEKFRREVENLTEKYGDLAFRANLVKYTVTEKLGDSKYFPGRTDDTERVSGDPRVDVSQPSSSALSQDAGQLDPQQGQIIDFVKGVVPDVNIHQSTVIRDERQVNDGLPQNAHGLSGQHKEIVDFVRSVDPDANIPEPTVIDQEAEADRAPPPDLDSVYRSYAGEEINIYRQGNLVTITDAENKPVFQFEYDQRGRIKIHKDEITNHPKLYQKFVDANEALKTLSPHTSINDVLNDPTYESQTRYLGSLAPAGSHAIATAKLVTRSKKELQSFSMPSNSEGSEKIVYQRKTVKEEDTSVDKFIVYKDKQGEKSLLAFGENGAITHESTDKTDYAQLRKNYLMVKERIQQHSTSMKNSSAKSSRDSSYER